MPRNFRIDDSLVSKIPDVVVFGSPCVPRILIVVDGLSYEPGDGFGLSRFIESITLAAGVTTKPVLTLADRFLPPNPSVTIGPDNYNIKDTFNFATANPAVTLANYDQIWLFGIDYAAFALSDAEVGVISTFMNRGGGLFATGDHATLGQAMCGELPRVRHMRDWSSIPMGLELDAATAVQRIDTVVDPGANSIHEFIDQSDEIPQRIYPNYKVTDLDMATASWEATVHPLMMLPGAVSTRNDAPDFQFDLDCLPDHPHESVCKETPAADLAGAYNINGQNFVEYQPLVSNPAVRAKAEIVAFAVSGGRSVQNGGWKPPVTPRMFPIISAYDGRLAQAYAGSTARPGRIVCDSTWHHYVNVNLDGTDTPRTGLGTGVGNAFVPGPHLLRIYAFYRNIVRWLQPANRVWCPWFWNLVALRYHSMLIEELMATEVLQSWESQVALGRAAAELLALSEGRGALDDMLGAVLIDDPDTQPLGDLFAARELRRSDLDPDELKHGILGGSLVKLAEMLPLNDRKAATAILKRGIEKNVKALAPEVPRLASTALAAQTRRAERRIALLRDQRFSKLVPR